MPRRLYYDRLLCGIVLALTFFGLLMMFSVTTADTHPRPHLLVKQCVAAAIGLFVMRQLMFRDYHEWRSQRVVFGVAGAAIILLIVALIFGSGANTNRFLRFGYLSFQPSEAAKLALVVFLAYYLEAKQDRINHVRSLVGGGLVIAALCALVLGGRDLGTTISLLLISAAVFWAAGLRFRYFAVCAAVAAPVLALAVWLDPYRWRRLTIFLDPESDPQGAGFQVIQSKIAVGSGGWFGQGFMLGRQKMRFLPEAHTDFIFAVIGEELGLIGCALAVLAFGVVLWRGLRAAARAPDNFGCYLAVGATAMIVCQAAINMGVVLGMLPTKGLPLPFISYGGTAMIASLAAAGMLLNVSQYSE